MLAAKCQRFYKAGDPTVWLSMPLAHLVFFLAEIEPLKAEESLRRVHEIRLAHAPSGEDGESARMVEREWRAQTNRDDRIIEVEDKPKMTQEEYNALLGIAGVARREWVLNDG